MRRRLSLAGLALALIVVLAGVASAVPGQRVLVVEDADTGERLLTTPVEEGTTVAIEYTHSVEKSRVYEAYEIRGGEPEFEITRSEFHSYGWGYPSNADIRNENGTLAYDPPGRYEQIPVVPGRTANHRLHVGDRTYDLVALAGGENAVTIDVRRRSMLETAVRALA